MGLTGLGQDSVEDVVDEIADVSNVGIWIAADSATAQNVINEVNRLFNVEVDVVVLSHGTGGTVVSGRAGTIGGHTVVIRQTTTHYDAYVP